MRSANDGLWGKSSQLPVFFVSCFLLDHGHAYSFPGMYGYIKAVASEMGSCNRNWPSELKSFSLVLYRKKKKKDEEVKMPVAALK